VEGRERQALRQGGCEAAVRTGLDVVGPSESQQVCVMDSVSALW